MSVPGPMTTAGGRIRFHHELARARILQIPAQFLLVFHPEARLVRSAIGRTTGRPSVRAFRFSVDPVVFLVEFSFGGFSHDPVTLVTVAGVNEGIADQVELTTAPGTILFEVLATKCSGHSFLLSS